MVSPDDEEPNRIDLSETPPESAEPPPEPPPPTPVKRKRRSLFASLFSTLLLLAFLAGAAVYAAIAFKDRDERLKAVADYAEPYVDQASVVFDELKNRLGALLGEKESTQEKEPAQATADAPEAPPAAPPEPAQTAPAQPTEAASEPAQTAPASPEAQPAPPTESAEMTPAKPAETAAEPTLNEQRPEPVANAASEAQNAAVTALQSRLDAAEALAQRALRAAEAAETAAKTAQADAEAAKARPATDAAAPGAALTPSDQLTALEGRIDELGEEMKALRGRLESPKNESRAAPEAAPAKTPEGPAALVVVAYALQRELEAGRPYAVEAKALARLGADPEALATLSPFAEKGAPTAAQLKADFAPAAKRIRALENGDSGDLAQHLMKGASKLVRVRPSGAPSGEAQSVVEKVSHIDAALAHGDLAQASALFAALPETAQNEAKDFGAALQARIDAGRAAEALLHGAIAALVATKE